MTHQVKCFLNKSLKSASQIRGCIEKIEKSEIVDDKEMLQKDLQGMNDIKWEHELIE